MQRQMTFSPLRHSLMHRACRSRSPRNPEVHYRRQADAQAPEHRPRDAAADARGLLRSAAFQVSPVYLHLFVYVLNIFELLLVSKSYVPFRFGPLKVMGCGTLNKQKAFSRTGQGASITMSSWKLS